MVCLLIGIATSAQELTDFKNRSQVSLQIGLHQVGLPFYKMIDDPANLSIKLGFSYLFSKQFNETGGFYQELALGWHENRYSSKGFLINTTTSYRYLNETGMFAETGIGFGLSLLRTPGTVFQFENGNYQPAGARYLFIPHITSEFAFGYQFADGTQGYIEYNPFLELNYPNLGLLPQGLVSLGYKRALP